MTLRRKSREPADPNRVYFGRILKPHGLRGEVKFKSFGCAMDMIAEMGRFRFEPAQGKPAPPFDTLELEGARGSAAAPILKFRQAGGKDEAEMLSGGLIWTTRGELPALGEGLVYETDILFATVQTPDGNILGRVEEIIETGAHDVLAVRAAGGEILLPFNEDVVKEIRLEENLIVVVPPVYAGGE